MKKLFKAALFVIGLILLVDFGYSRFVAHQWRQWEAEIQRDTDFIRAGCQPFMTGNADSSVAILMVHGFADSPPIFRPMAERLANAGFRCRVMRVPGFGMPLSVNSKLLTKEWMLAVDQELRVLRKSHEKVVVVGHSLGAAISIQHTLNRPESVDGLVLLAPLIAVSDERAPILSARQWYQVASTLLNFSTVVRNVYPIDGYSDQAKSFAYRERFIPRRIYDNLFELLDMIDGRAAEIEVPILLAASRRDRVINWNVAEQFLKTTNSTSKKLIRLDEAGHALPLDNGWEQLTDNIIEFAKSEI